MLKFFQRSEIALGFLLSALFWIPVLGWQASYSPAERQKEECYEAAKKNGYKQDECKSFWEKVTSDPIALFNLILAFSTVGLWVATISLRRAGNNQIRLAREEFIASHRPRIRINRIFPIEKLFPNTQTRLIIEAANIGDTKATITEVGFDIYIEGQPFNAIPQPYPGSEPVPPGKEARMTAFSNRMLSEAEINAIETGISEWRLLGIVNYTDDNGVMRSTSFMRVYNRAMSRFVKVTEYDPDYDREFEN